MERIQKYITIDGPYKVNGRKTDTWYVKLKATGEVVGTIKWYGGWRKYAFFDVDGNYYDSDFMRLIADFCDNATAERL